MADNYDPVHVLRQSGSALATASSRSMRPSHGSRHVPSTATATLTPAYFWWVFRQWWMILVPVMLVLAGAAATVIMLTYEPDYRASAIIKIEESAPYIVYSPVGGEAGASRYVQT